MRFDLTTKASPEQVLRAMTDFTQRRLEIWHKTLDPKVYEVREVGETWAVAREGSPGVPFWVVVRYDWSDPRVIRWTELETNHGDSGGGSMRIEPGDAEGSRVYVEWTTHPVRMRDKIAMFLLHHTMNRTIARMWRKTLDRYATSNPV
jgi:Polyketide cyclase / dehydrase and lipid transport